MSSCLRLLCGRYQHFCFRLQARDVALDVVMGFDVDDGPHIRGHVGRITRLEFLGRTLQHFNDAIGDALVHTQEAQCRAALPGRAERAHHHRVDDLLGQCAGVDQHGVDAASLSDQRNNRAVLHGQRTLDDFGHLG